LVKIAVANIGRIRPRVWVPPIYTSNYKITVTRSNGTIDDITEICHLFEYEDGVTDTIGQFKFEIWNPNETYTKAWTGFEVVKFYNDYAATSTTLRFRGRIEKPLYRDNKIICSGRSESLRLMEITVTQDYDNIECSVILKDILDTYGTGFTYTNVAASTVSITTKWNQKPFWECVKELTTSAGFDIYVDSALDFHFFKSGSVSNTGEAIVHDYNLMEVGEFANDLTFVKNRIIVYGAEQDGTQVLATAEDATSQDDNGLREEVIRDDSVVSETQAQERADYELSNKKDPPQVGDVKGVMLATIQPGEKIRLSSPENNLPPALYQILSFKQSVNFNRGFYTTVKVNKEPRKFSHIIAQNINIQNQQKTVSFNPEEMRYSYNFPFDTDSGTHTNTEITGGVLKPTGASGTWISDTRDLTSDLTDAYLKVNGEVLDGAVVSVSGNAGTDYQELTNKGKISVTTATGTKLKVKVVFDNADTRIQSLSLLYKIS